MKKLAVQRQSDIKYPIQLDHARPVSRLPAAQGRHSQRRVVRRRDDCPRARARRGGCRSDARAAESHARARRQAMKEGALGVGSVAHLRARYYAETPELVALTSEAAKCGGMYISHMRCEGNRLLEAIDELITISKAVRRAGRNLPPQAGRPAELGQARCRHRQGRSRARATASASPPTCTPTRPARPASMRPCRPGCSQAAWRRGSSA